MSKGPLVPSLLSCILKSTCWTLVSFVTQSIWISHITLFRLFFFNSHKPHTSQNFPAGRSSHMTWSQLLLSFLQIGVKKNFHYVFCIIFGKKKKNWNKKSLPEGAIVCVENLGWQVYLYCIPGVDVWGVYSVYTTEGCILGAMCGNILSTFLCGVSSKEGLVWVNNVFF